MQNREQDDDVADGSYAVKPGKSVKLLAHALSFLFQRRCPARRGRRLPLRSKGG